MQADTKDVANAMGGEPPQAEFAAAFEDVVNREVAFENEIASVFQLSRV